MRTYLNSLHTRSDSHKKRFAFLVSAGCTLLIFSLWSLAHFGNAGSTSATITDANGDSNTAALIVATGAEDTMDQEDTTTMVTPFENFKSGLSSSMAALKKTLNNGN